MLDFILFLLSITFICFGFLGMYFGWTWFTTKDCKIYEVVKRKDAYYVQNNNGRYLANDDNCWWPAGYKEKWCKFTTPELAGEHLKKHGYTNDNMTYVNSSPSPACQLKQQFYNWLKEDC